MFNEKPELLKLDSRSHRIVGFHQGTAFVVLKGSEVEWQDKKKPCMYKSNRAILDQLYQDGVVVLTEGPTGISYRLARDVTFNSPGQATSVLLGSHGRGSRKRWKPCIDPDLHLFGPKGASAVLRLWRDQDGRSKMIPWISPQVA